MFAEQEQEEIFRNLEEMASLPEDELTKGEHSLLKIKSFLGKLDYKIFTGVLEIVLWACLLWIDIAAAFISRFEYRSYSLPITQAFIGVGACLLILKACIALFQLGKLRFEVVMRFKLLYPYKRSLLAKPVR